jgi:hypothetical protein
MDATAIPGDAETGFDFNLRPELWTFVRNHHGNASQSTETSLEPAKFRIIVYDGMFVFTAWRDPTWQIL